MSSKRLAYPRELTFKIIDRARELGFIGIGFSRPSKPLYFDEFISWISRKKNGDMSWLERNTEIREEPQLILEGCRTIISLAYPYPSTKPSTPDGFSVSRYSQPSEKDYHFRLKVLCRELEKVIKPYDEGSKTRVCVDSVPILERSCAYASGMGFIGKNNMMIIPGSGSYLYLAEILTTTHFEFVAVRPLENQCGSCQICIESCPTGALEGPFSLDASRCLSYLTIEYRGRVDGSNGKRMGDCFFGCDICQEVCPFNHRKESRQISLPSSGELLTMDETVFQEEFGRTALSRAGLEKIKENIMLIRG